MFAYCDMRSGDILFADAVPKNGEAIAQHDSEIVLRTALNACNVHQRQRWGGRPPKPVGEPVLSVPWFVTSEDESETVAKFAALVQSFIAGVLVPLEADQED